MKKYIVMIMISIVGMCLLVNGATAGEEGGGNVTFFPPVNNPDSPVIRCEYCHRVLGEEVEPWYPARDPEFKKYRLYQVCTECAARLYPKGYYKVIMKKKWYLLEYHIACLDDGLNQFWAKHGPEAVKSRTRMLAKADALQ
ncbi:MAG: hypothetical protein U9N73_12360 [Candidatus Auribacterota bacterium]|nr:hypothetical protein [Candidatus Auribacterota bacterium]